MRSESSSLVAGFVLLVMVGCVAETAIAPATPPAESAEEEGGETPTGAAPDAASDERRPADAGDAEAAAKKWPSVPKPSAAPDWAYEARSQFCFALYYDDYPASRLGVPNGYAATLTTKGFTVVPSTAGLPQGVLDEIVRIELLGKVATVRKKLVTVKNGASGIAYYVHTTPKEPLAIPPPFYDSFDHEQIEGRVFDANGASGGKTGYAWATDYGGNPFIIGVNDCALSRPSKPLETTCW